MQKETNLSWFLREEVESEISEKIMQISYQIRNEKVDPESDRALEIASEYIDWEKYTSEEFEMLVRSMIAQTTLLSLESRGLVEEVSPGKYKITEIGKLVSDQLEKI